MIKVSIIIAAYNVEKYINRCLESLINQTLKETEIICINDGSTDRTLAILEDYAKKDSRIIVLSQENAKQGAARNRGIDIAQGEFITFVDADDWVDLDFCEKLYNAAQKYGVNIAASSTTRDYKHVVKNHLKLTDECVYKGVNSIVQALEYNLITHSKLYRFEPIKDLRFEENVLYEDAPYTIKAFDKCESLVTVPDTTYHYYSNPTSTMKQKLDVKKENDKISTAIQLIRYAQEHNIKLSLKYSLVYKDDHFWWAVKHYYTKKEFYLCGIKIFTKNVKYDNVKNFVIFNTACFGDVLLCNSLVQNIKNIFPESRVIFVCDKNWEDVAKYQEGVDEVIIYDKKGAHRGFFGFIKFIKDFKYKNIYASFITYKNERNYAAAKLIGSRFVFMHNPTKGKTSMQEQHNKLLEPLTHKRIVDYPIKYNLPDNVVNPLNELNFSNKYIALCCTTKQKVKDIPLEVAAELISKINRETDCKVVIVGNGEKPKEHAERLKDLGCDFVDLVNKTTLLELGKVLKDSECLISADTGTMHFGYSLGVKTLCLFFEQGTNHLWAPKEDVYKHTILLNDDLSINNIFENLIKLRGQDE